jgi:hypothetical protein
LLLLDFSKLVICGGLAKGGFPTDNCEVINLEPSASTCKNLPNFPATVYGAIGGFEVKGNSVICGGWQNYNQSSKCFSLENNTWVSSYRRNSAKTSAASSQLQDGQLIVTGGQNSSLDNLNSAEILTEEGWESTMPALPVTIVDHCMVTVNYTTVMVIGGWQNDKYSGKTFYFTFGEESWTEGPRLKQARFWHSCGKIRRNKASQELSIIAAGGSDGSSAYLSSVEILDIGSNEWQTGPKLPFGIYWSQMVEAQNGGVVLIAGFSNSTSYLDTLFQLPHVGHDALWTKMEQKLKIGRNHHIAFLVPDNVVDCS